MSTTRQNLALLALGLHRLSRKLGSEGFNISYYLADINCGNRVNRIAYDQQLADRLRTSLEYYPDHPCGTTACAVGHGPLFGLEVPDAASTPIMPWTSYIEEQFPDLSERAAQWMFASVWGSMDLELETAGAQQQWSRGAAASRIAWALTACDYNDAGCHPFDYVKWAYRPKFEAWEPDWDAIEAMIPAEKLEGIAWIDNIGKEKEYSDE